MSHASVDPVLPENHPSGTPPRLLLYNEFPLMAQAITRTLNTELPHLRVDSLAAESEIVQPTDLALFDPMTTPLPSRWTNVEALTRHPRVGTVALFCGHLPGEWIQTGREHGVDAHISKTLSPSQLSDAAMRLGVRSPEGSQRRSWSALWPGRAQGLSQRESETLAHVASGASNGEIAVRMYISINTLKTYIRSAYRKIGAQNRSQAVRWAFEHGVAGAIPRDQGAEHRR